MQLNFKQYSTQGMPLIILHGLFGGLGNWGRHSKDLAEKFAVYGLDLRNHGVSPHSDEMNYQLIAGDVLEFLDANNITNCHLMGHSMGGKVAMELALNHPHRIKRLIIVDIAPVSYLGSTEGHDKIFAAMDAIDTEKLQSRKEADEKMQPYIEEASIRQFLLTNLYKNGDGRFDWRLNLEALRMHYDELRKGIESEHPYEKEVLFIKGADSNYITEENAKDVLALFPFAHIKTVMEAGHWIHAEKPQAFQKIVLNFLIDAGE